LSCHSISPYWSLLNRTASNNLMGFTEWGYFYASSHSGQSLLCSPSHPTPRRGSSKGHRGHAKQNRALACVLTVKETKPAEMRPPCAPQRSSCQPSSRKLGPAWGTQVACVPMRWRGWVTASDRVRLRRTLVTASVARAARLGGWIIWLRPDVCLDHTLGRSHETRCARFF
jgi:hypothetical protein